MAQKLPKLIADASHDLRTPLATIKLVGQLMAKRHVTKNYDEFDAYLNTIDRKVDEMATIINTLVERLIKERTQK